MPLVSLLFRSFGSVSIRCLISSVSSGNFVIVVISYISSQGHRQQPLQHQHGELCVIQVGLKGGAGDLNPVLARYVPVSVLYFFGSILREYLGRSETGNMKVKLSYFLEDIDSLQIFFIYLFEKQRDSESTHMLPLHSSHIHSCSPVTFMWEYVLTGRLNICSLFNFHRTKVKEFQSFGTLKPIVHVRPIILA